MCLNGRPLVGRTANKARDSFLLYLTLNSLPEAIILWGTSLGVGEANDELTPGNIAIFRIARRSWKTNPALDTAIVSVEVGGVDGSEGVFPLFLRWLSGR